MNVDLIFKVAAIGIIVSILHTLVSKSGRDEQAMLIVLAGLVVVLMVMAKEIVALFDTLKNLFQL